MAQTGASRLFDLTQGLLRLSNLQKAGILAVIAATIAVIVVAFLWARVPDYRVLYSNLSERDGGEVIAALTQLNVPYRVAEGGSAVLAPSAQIYDLRLKLAAQGLPKGGAVGFELMDGQKFGVSQFAEQVNFQRALAGELARSIQSLTSVQAARVHLAIPRPTPFMREQAAPSASVLVSLYPSRVLDTGQVAAIQHLVAASVPRLSVRHVTVVDQSGNLLSANSALEPATGALDAGQLSYLRAVEAAYAGRIESILVPIVGAGNVRAQVAANLDFSAVEQTSETYQPNTAVDRQAIRSQQTIDTASGSRQPVPNPSDPPAAKRTLPGGLGSLHRESTVNYEVDKTVRHVKAEKGTVKRLSAAVVVNFEPRVDATGARTLQPRSEREMAQIQQLVREAIGLEAQRGDSLNVMNAPFSTDNVLPDVVTTAPASLGDALRLALAAPATVPAVARYLAIALIALAALLVLRSIARRLLRAGRSVGLPASVTQDAPAAGSNAQRVAPSVAASGDLDADLQTARDLARDNPRAVANVLREWLARDA